MEDKMKRLITTLIVLTISLAAFCEVHDNAGQYGFKFLQNPVNPVSLSLGGRGSIASNPASFVIQPASQTWYSHQTVSASHTLWFADTRFTNLSYSTSDRKSHFGLLLRTLDYGDLENRDDAGNLIGYYNPVDMNMMVNYSVRTSPSSYAGLNLGVLYERLNTASAYGVNADLGFTYLPPIADTRMQFALRNLGYTSKMNAERIDLPITFETELVKGFDFDGTRLDLGAVAIKASDEDIKGAVFTQLQIYEIFSIRAGYKLNYAAEDLTAGIGIRVKGFDIDYGWASYSSQIDDVHSFGISYNF